MEGPQRVIEKRPLAAARIAGMSSWRTPPAAEAEIAITLHSNQSLVDDPRAAAQVLFVTFAALEK